MDAPIGDSYPDQTRTHAAVEPKKTLALNNIYDGLVCRLYDICEGKKAGKKEEESVCVCVHVHVCISDERDAIHDVYSTYFGLFPCVHCSTALSKVRGVDRQDRVETVCTLLSQRQRQP